jgi:hypothetical protein
MQTQTFEDVLTFFLEKAIKALEGRSSDEMSAECHQWVEETKDLLNKCRQTRRVNNKTSDGLGCSAGLSSDESSERAAVRESKTTFRSAGETAELRLAPFCDDFRRSNMTDFLGPIEFAGTTDKDRWLEIQRLLLRLPKRHRDRWEKVALADVQKIGLEPVEDRDYLQGLDYWRDEVVFRGLKGPVQVAGLGLRRSKDLGKSVDGLLARASCLSDLCLFFAQEDGQTRHALEDLRRSNTYALRGKELDAYSRCVRDRLALLRQAVEEQADPSAEFRAWVRHAESVLSLVYEPPADVESSWWSGIHTDVQDLIEEARARNQDRGKNEIEVRWMQGAHKEQRQWTTDQDIMIDRSFGSGEVVACLRPYVRIGSDRRLGRVIYSRY